ncbi:GtrA family protein [Sphingobium scionense]|nr:GtrA family protein [Sphingobium scionense]
MANLLLLARFGIAGGSVTLIGYLVFLTSVAMGLHYILASIGAWVASVCIGFFAHRHLTFSGHAIRRSPMLRYLGICLMQLLVGTATLALMIDVFGLVPWIAYPANVLLTATISYVLMRRAMYMAHPAKSL